MLIKANDTDKYKIKKEIYRLKEFNLGNTNEKQKDGKEIMFELLMILLIMFKGLKGKEVTIKTFIALPIIMLLGLHNDYNGIKSQSFEDIIEIIVLLIIAVIILGNMKIIEVNNGKYYIKSTYKYIGSWLVILVIRLLVSKVIFKSHMANDDWITWAYFLVFYATRSIAVLLKYPEVAAIIKEQKQYINETCENVYIRFSWVILTIFWNIQEHAKYTEVR